MHELPEQTHPCLRCVATSGSITCDQVPHKHTPACGLIIHRRKTFISYHEVYEETLEDNGRFNEQPALPFNAYGTMALARSEFETNSGSSQFFFLLKARPQVLLGPSIRASAEVLVDHMLCRGARWDERSSAS